MSKDGVGLLEDHIDPVSYTHLGKSNITESLRWALGESSVKSLRGGKMPDVIFAGTESRKPLNYACVTVVLDNQDGFIQQAGKEIRVERHIYRSGDSEYKIDGKKVRLRDCLLYTSRCV